MCEALALKLAQLAVTIQNRDPLTATGSPNPCNFDLQFRGDPGQLQPGRLRGCENQLVVVT